PATAAHRPAAPTAPSPACKSSARVRPAPATPAGTLAPTPDRPPGWDLASTHDAGYSVSRAASGAEVTCTEWRLLAATCEPWSHLAGHPLVSYPSSSTRVALAQEHRPVDHLVVTRSPLACARRVWR